MGTKMAFSACASLGHRVSPGSPDLAPTACVCDWATQPGSQLRLLVQAGPQGQVAALQSAPGTKPNSTLCPVPCAQAVGGQGRASTACHRSALRTCGPGSQVGLATGGRGADLPIATVLQARSGHVPGLPRLTVSLLWVWMSVWPSS